MMLHGTGFLEAEPEAGNQVRVVRRGALALRRRGECSEAEAGRVGVSVDSASVCPTGSSGS